MDKEKVRQLLQAVARGALQPDQALARLRDLPVDDLRFARVDLHRSLRHGVPEAVFCQGKTPEQVVAMVSAPRVEAEEPVTPEVPAEPELVGRKAEAEEPEGEEGAKEPAKKGAAPPKAEAAKKPEPAKRAEAPRKEKEKEGK